MPEKLVAMHHKINTWRKGGPMLSKVYMSVVDLDLYTNPLKEGETVNDRAAAMTKVRPYTTKPILPEDRFFNQFKHIFAGGYAAGYYSYAWAEVLSADAFSR